ncbi:hypothetical protein [Arenimonas oryziterrae]|uniref:Uncharacterized protein n=1 Tax=Arenimonas oryziterrae DSM 21050 = YC6267 TaxID=1121015 RepID=A0A091AW22_9GAMM|nr:hypothetical protein [Arenimonas oryziterrae]KFN43656.1 hypothetical protein N789_10290 [Arenimonas oryziterrae DSM 21050 = YC6267]
MSESTPAPDRGYRLTFLLRDDILEVGVSGDIDAQAIRIAYWQEIVAVAVARGCRKLLVTDRKKGKPARPEELAELARLLRSEREHFDRVAVIEPTPDFLPAIEHAEILGLEQGINVRVFGHYAQAASWLRYGSPDD